MFHFLCTSALLYVVVSLIWPHLGSSNRKADEGRHKELLRALDSLERQRAAPPPLPPPLPTFNSVERARIIALGRVRDGAKRHPILDAPYVSVAGVRKEET